MNESVTNQLDRIAGDTEWAAPIVGLSSQTLEKTRRSDRERKEQGLPPEGPCWIKIGKRVVYRLEDLRDWLESKYNEQWVIDNEPF